jgi:hypothetical protein
MDVGYDTIAPSVLFKYISYLVSQNAFLKDIKITATTHTGGMLYIGDGKELHTPLSRMSCEASISHDSIYGFDLEGMCISVYQIAEEFCENLEKGLFSALYKITDFTGNVVDAHGQGINYDVLLETIEKLQIDFDDDGKPKLPTMVVHPDTKFKLDVEGEAAYNARLDDIIARKKEVFYAKKGRRRLSRIN